MTTREIEFAHFMALQLAEVKEHKWYLSESAGYDVGAEAALSSWVESGHAERFRERYESHHGEMERLCNACRYQCTIKTACQQEMDLIHRLLED